MKALKYVAPFFLFLQLYAGVVQGSETDSIESNSSTHFGNKKHKQKSGRGIFYNFNNFADTTTLVPNATVPFNSIPEQSRNIKQTALDTITFKRSGDYLVTFIAFAQFPTTDIGITLVVNGSQVDSGTPITFGDTPLIIQRTLSINIVPPATSATLQVVITGTGAGVIFTAGPSATITILQLSQN